MRVVIIRQISLTIPEKEGQPHDQIERVREPSSTVGCQWQHEHSADAELYQKHRVEEPEGEREYHFMSHRRHLE